MNTIQRRRPATLSRRCIRMWFRHRGRIVRVINYEDYSRCSVGGKPRSFYKLLDHARYARGVYMADLSGWFATQVLPHIQPLQWVEVEIK